MSDTDQQTAVQTVLCPNCGRENAAERLFCQFCRHRIATAVQDALIASGPAGASLVEAQQVLAALQAAQGEKKDLLQQVEALKAQLDEAHAATADPISPTGIVEEVSKKLTGVEGAATTPQSATPQSTTTQSLAGDVEKTWKSVEAKVVSLEEKVTSKAKDIEADLQKKPQVSLNPNSAQPGLGSAPPANKPAEFDPRKTVAFGGIKSLPVVAWVVILNGAQKGEDFRLIEGKNSLGSAAASNIKLSDPAVSAEHASINYREGKFVISDLDSTNGTFMNDDSEPVARVVLQDGDVIRVGETSLKFKSL